MARRKRRKNTTGAFGLAMLDIVSNSLAAVIILFFILSALRIPSIPIERICGTGEVIITIYDNENDAVISKNVQADIFIRLDTGSVGNSTEHLDKLKKSIYWSENIDDFNKNFNAANFEQIYPSCVLEEDEIQQNNIISVSHALDGKKGNEAQQHITFRNPPINFSFDVGLIYNHHDLIDKDKKPVRVVYDIIWKEENSVPLTTEKIDTLLLATTGRVYLNIDWNTKKITPELNVQ